jgi:CubicO group peptidase (beta-lactamase class C family)
MPFLPRLAPVLALATTSLILQACDPGGPVAPGTALTGSVSPAILSEYFPPPEAAGGWRKTKDATEIRRLGLAPAKLDALGAYLTSLPYEGYATGVKGYKPSNKAALIVKNGWLVGEYYNQASAKTGLYYLASNGKSFALLLAGNMVQQYPEYAFGLGSKLYDPRWLPEGFPLTDPRKEGITFDHVFRHVSGIIPEAQHRIASGSVQDEPDWDFETCTVGKDDDWPQSAPLYYAPGNPSTYTKGTPYSSVAFNHFSLVFRNVTGLEAGAYLRQAILDPIGVEKMEYKLTPGMGDYRWAVAGNGLARAPDFMRIGYLMLHEGEWNGTRIFPASWIRQFTSETAYTNLRTNLDCRWGPKYPRDMYRTTGSGLNWVLVVPSMDLLLSFNGRTPKSLRAAVDSTSLAKLFAAVKEPYVACDGTLVNAR